VAYIDRQPLSLSLVEQRWFGHLEALWPCGVFLCFRKLKQSETEHPHVVAIDGLKLGIGCIGAG
jgi:hypothetical protein